MKDEYRFPGWFPGWPLVGGGSGDGDADGGSDGDGSGADAGGAGGGDGDAESSSVDPADPIAVAAAFDAEALGEAGAADSGTEDGEEGEEGGSPARADSPISRLIKKNYGGNEDEFIAAFYENRAQQKVLADQIKELQAARNAPPARDLEAEFKVTRDSDAEVQAIDQEINDLVADTKAINARHVQIANAVSDLEAKIAKANGEFAHADDVEKPKLLHDLGVWEAKVVGLKSTFEALDSRRLTNETTFKVLARDRSRIEQSIRNELAEREGREKDAKVRNAKTWNVFTSSFDEFAEYHGLKPDSETFKYMKESVRSQLITYIDTLDEGIDAAGLHEAVGRIMRRAAAAGVIPKGAAPKGANGDGKGGRVAAPQKPLFIPRRPAGSAGRSATPAPRPNPGSSSSPRTIDDVLDDPAKVRERAVKVFEAVERANAARRSHPS